MQRARLNRPHECRVRTATLGIVFLATGVLPLAVPEPASAATLDRIQQTGKLTLGYRADAHFNNTQNQGNHVHSVWRDLKNDFGRDLLKEHLKTAHAN